MIFSYSKVVLFLFPKQGSTWMSAESRRKFIKVLATSAALSPLVGTLALSSESDESNKKLLKKSTCEYRLLRHAAAVFDYHGQRFLIDPMLNRIVNNVELPVTNGELRDILTSLDAVLLTHAHADHINLESWHINLLKDKPFFCQSSADGTYLESLGMNDVRVIGEKATFNDIDINKTGGQHGVNTGWNVSGFVFSAPGSEVVYIAGDTTYAQEVEDALDTFKPNVTIVNSGAVGPSNNPWTMTAEDVRSVAIQLPSTHIIAVHLEVHPNAKITRSELRKFTEENDIASRVRIPNDGDVIDLCELSSTSDIDFVTNAIGVHPNPFSEQVAFDVPGTLVDIRIMNLQGKLIAILDRPFWNGEDSNGREIPSGVYIAFVHTTEGRYGQKLFKY